jgi:hypothetical protein
LEALHQPTSLYSEQQEKALAALAVDPVEHNARTPAASDGDVSAPPKFAGS